MRTKSLVMAVVLVLLFAGIGAAFAESSAQFGVATSDVSVYEKASVKAKVVVQLAEGDSFRVLEIAKRDQKVDGKTGKWMRVSTAEGIEGWLHGARATVKSGFLTLADFSDSTTYGNYLAWALRKGERVRAVEDYEKVSAGDLGWYHSQDDGTPPILVVWDRDLSATPWVEAIPEDCPRVLSGRIYFVHPETIEAVGEDSLADFDQLAKEWINKGDPASIFPVGSRVILGKHLPAEADNPDSANWADRMDDYVGQEATITEHHGTDSWDRAVVTVDVDGGDYYWRVENLKLVERGSGQYEEDSDSDYDYDYGEESYSHEDYDEHDYALEEAFPVGSRVILGKHKTLDPQDEDSSYWAPEMDEYVGKEAVITNHEGLCPWGEPTATVDVDGGDFYWRLADMELLEKGSGYYESPDDSSDDESEDTEDHGSDLCGTIQEGTKVILGRHDEANGGDNWAEDMGDFVGQETVVTEILGTDSQGFTVVSVEGNEWSWRVRNLAVKGRGEPGSYGFAVGDAVVLGKHREVDGSSNWNPAMDAFVGKRAKITKLIGTEGDSSNCFLVKVDIDGGEWVWRVESLKPAE